MIFKSFDYQHPPSNGVFWIEFSVPETDVEADDSGNPVGWYTGEVIRKLGLVYIDNIEDNGLPFMAIPVDDDLCSFDDELALIHSYSLAALPDWPEESPGGGDWVEYTGVIDETRFATARWFWVAVKNEKDGHRNVTLAFHEIRDDQTVRGFESPGQTYYPLHELYAGDIITHILPLTIPTLPITVEPE